MIYFSLPMVGKERVKQSKRRENSVNALQWMAAVSAANNLQDLGQLIGQLLRNKSLADELCGQDMVAEAVEKAFARFNTAKLPATAVTAPKDAVKTEQRSKPSRERKPKRVFQAHAPCNWYGSQKRIEALQNGLEKAAEEGFPDKRGLTRSIIDKAQAAQNTPACDRSHRSCQLLDELLNEMVEAADQKTWKDDFQTRVEQLLNPPEIPAPEERKPRSSRRKGGRKSEAASQKPVAATAPPSGNGTAKPRVSLPDASSEMPF